MGKQTTSNRGQAQFADVFRWLRVVAPNPAKGLVASEDTSQTYTLVATIGPATVRIKGPKSEGAKLPVVYIHIGKAYVSYHLMGLYGNAALNKQISGELVKHKQGKTCFNFRHIHDDLSQELRDLTSQSITALRKAGYIL
jgi:hypothetical protein